MGSEERFQARISKEEKKSLGMKDKEFLLMALKLHERGLLKKVYEKIIKAEEKALKKITI